MAIVTNEFVEYDTTGRYYYLTDAGAVHYTGIEDLVELWNMNGTSERRLKEHGRMLKQKLISTADNQGEPRYRNIDFIEYDTFKNLNGERQSIIDTLANMVRVSFDNEWDIKFRSGEVGWNPYILEPVQTSGLYFEGIRDQDVIPSDEYQVGY